MQTSKLFSVICAFTMLAGVFTLRAVETEAQKRAREALHRKMQELEGRLTPPPAAPKPPAAASPGAVEPAEPPPAVTATTTSPATPVAAPGSPDNEAQARAREALRQKMYGGQVQTTAPAPVTPATPTPPPAPVVAPVTPAAIVAPASAPTTTPPAAPVATADSAAQAKAREALWLKMRELDSQQPVAPPIATPGTPAIPTVAFKPIEPPPSPISGSKAGKLSELLRQYRADQITPADYHKQRAAILAEK